MEARDNRKGTVEMVSASQVYNLPLYEAFFVIDCREVEKYEAGHIASAFNFPPPNEYEDKELCLHSFIAHAADNCCNDRWNPVVIYGDQSNKVVSHMAWVVERLLWFIETPNVETSDWFLKYMSQRTEHVWIIQSGYDEFVRDYPPLKVVSDNPGASTMVPLPYQVAGEGGGLFIGSRAIEWTKSLVKSMGIQTVVLDKAAAKGLESDGVAFPLEYFLCSISNANDDEMGTLTVWSRNRLEELFERATEFIQNSLLRNRRVLIQLEGRSASAALAVAWHMRYQRRTFDEARAVVFASTPRDPAVSDSSVLDTRLLFEKELRLWERSARFQSYG